ncbi:MAG TPA: ABC transporter permease [Streptosporangiaceae bacterium]|nr:ABC transporter permease [Streptosporangiaceae bacterium]
MSDTATPRADAIGTPPAAPPAGGGHPSGLTRLTTVFLRQREATVLVIAVAMFIYFSLSAPDFLTRASITNISQYMAPYVILAIGEVLLLVCGEIDLSVGFVWTMSPFLMMFLVNWGLPVILAIIVTVALSTTVGLINGVVTTYFGVPSLITTVGTGFIVLGFTLQISAAQQKPLPPSSVAIGHWFGTYAWSEIIWATVLVVVFQILLTRTRWGLYTISAGGNLLGAAEAGVKIRKIKIGNFMAASGLGAFAGVLEAFKNSIIDPSAGTLDVVLIALVGAVIGGTAMAGGSGTMIGAWVGMLVLGILNDGFNLLGISTNPYQIILGVAIVVAMVANTYLTRLRRAGRT